MDMIQMNEEQARTIIITILGMIGTIIIVTVTSHRKLSDNVSTFGTDLQVVKKDVEHIKTEVEKFSNK